MVLADASPPALPVWASHGAQALPLTTRPANSDEHHSRIACDGVRVYGSWVVDAICVAGEPL